MNNFVTSIKHSISINKSCTPDLIIPIVNGLLSTLKSIANNRFVMMQNKNVWYDRDNPSIYPKFDSFSLPTFNTKIESSKNYKDSFEGFEFVSIYIDEAKKSFSDSTNPYLIDGTYKFFSLEINKILTDDGHTWLRSDGNIYSWNDNNFLTVVPIHRLSDQRNFGCSNETHTVYYWIINSLFPEVINSNFIDILKLKDFIYLIDDKIYFDDLSFKKAILNGSFNDSLFGFIFNSSKNSLNISVDKNSQINIIPNIKNIDFGTKSTVVICLNKYLHLLRIGKGNYEKAPSINDYENPTVIELRDLDSFINYYKSRISRPFTQWEQITVSYQATDAIFQNPEDSSIYYSVFSDLKQWANSKVKRLKLKDRQGKIFELKSYAQLNLDDFDPIEVYDYYLVLYINNMHNNIYLDYILFFPITYEFAIRERIRQSFERGIKKSLPHAILNDIILYLCLEFLLVLVNMLIMLSVP